MKGGEVVTLAVMEAEPQRVDLFIASAVASSSRTQVKRSIGAGHVTVNGQPIYRASVRVSAGDTVQWTVPHPRPLVFEPEPLDLDIVYEDDHLLVINKPAGMPTHPGTGHSSGTLVNGLLHHTGNAAMTPTGSGPTQGLSTSPEGPHVRPGIVHRLDMFTSGLLVVAKDDVTHRGLSAQFEDRTIRRSYRAIVWGVPDPAEGRVEAPVWRDPRNRERRAVAPEGRGKHATTNYKVLRPLAHTAWVSFRLETGRTHQIRVHAQHINHPLLGDPLYGGRWVRYGPVTGPRRYFFRQLFDRLTRQALHAAELGFVHPHTQEWVAFEQEAPADIKEALQTLSRDV